MARSGKRSKAGGVLLGEFLEANDISNAACGRALGVSRPTVKAWRDEQKFPEGRDRKAAIAKWTKGYVPIASWPESKKEAAQRKALDQVEPFTASGTDG